MLSLTVKQILDKGFPNLSYKLAPPEIKTHGHLATNIAFALAKVLKKSPLSAAEDAKKHILDNSPKDLIAKIDIAVPGFINIWFTKTAIQKEFLKISKTKNWGKTNLGRKGKKAQKVIVEYSSPNIAKPMHVGHFRGTIIGDAVANIHEFLGYKTVRWNYVGDWGTQFGKLTAAFRLWGDEKKLKAEPIKHLLELYVRFSAESKTNPELEKKGQEEFRKLEEGDKENRKLWEKFRKASIEDFNKTYKLLGVKFNVSIGESFYEKDLKPITEYLISQEIAVRSEGALIIPMDDFNLPPAMVQKSDGVSLYLTRDIANILYRIKKYHSAKILYVVGNEQELHFKQLFTIARADFLYDYSPELKNRQDVELFHIGHGLVLGEDGKKLSTRAGKTIFMEEVIQEAVDKTKKIIEAKNPSLSIKEKNKIAEVVAIGALKYNDLSQNRLSNITFDWDKMLSFEGDSGPYLQYSYARLKSIIRKSRVSNSFDTKYLSTDLELDIIQKLDRFPEIIESVAKTYYPNDLASYLYDLAKSINHFYQVEPILKSEPSVQKARLALISACASTLKTGLNLLGIEVIDRM